MGLKDEKELPAIKIVKTNHNNLHISRDQFEENLRKEKELEARMAIETEKIKDEIEKEDRVKKVKKFKKEEKEEEI